METLYAEAGKFLWKTTNITTETRANTHSDVLWDGTTTWATKADGSLWAWGVLHEISGRSEGAGGALADFDALSLVNPATIAGVGSAALFFQYSSMLPV